MEYYIVDAFAEAPFGGNPAGVVLLGDGVFPEARLMQLIAAELRYSETVFVRQLAEREFALRYFTLLHEVELCGHATIAAFVLLHRKGLASGACLCHTQAGALRVEAAERVMMQMAAPRIVSTISEVEPLYRAVGLTGYRPALPVQVAYAGLADIMLPVSDLPALNALQPDMEAIAALTEHHGAVSLHPFAFAADGHTAHVRDFAPRYGVPEEAATGTANAALTFYLWRCGCVEIGAECAFVQGETMGRPSVVRTQLRAETQLFVGGTAVVLAQGQLLL